MAKTTTAKKIEDNATTFANDVKSYAHQIWLAGLGAYAKAGKEGADYFKKLVTEGEALEKQGKEIVSTQVDAANSRIESFKEKVQEKTGGRFSKVEEVFDERVASTLGRMGIPSKKDIDQLSAKLDDLSAALKSLQSK
ncbi:poly(3-hydroxyalkanoate) granule-associated protein PhaI [Pseudomonas neustonica]|uniref:Poly(3-hydroxyalkanoate) granule-associated protein PhaI n=1 Tax=Pseudomonas neustonica TaxID=2487346 RepID=A0ABX9XG58_9PSED|nr:MULTISPECIES: phasin family protein [Pseudomonas]ROZ83355.1 poly(3-hydroxyalkanoate) granule-associated protein PhaI [Pseudomonas neustonica]|tara:strand:+ start:623 stop:1036 length:414 start_codon:yes stop_codon:yes gene_type:complete